MQKKELELGSISFILRQAAADVAWLMAERKRRDSHSIEWPGRLCLLLGVGRSGTSWVGDVLAAANRENLAYLKEPLTHLSKPILFNHTPDNAALGFRRQIHAPHRLWSIMAAITQNPRSPLLAENARPFGVNSAANRVLVKEVHALLATHHLLARGVSTVAMVRRPLDILRGIYNTFGSDVRYLEQESIEVRKSPFLSYIGLNLRPMVLRWDGKSSARLLVTIHLLHRYFRRLALQYPYLKTVRYEDLKAHPLNGFETISRHFALPTGLLLEQAISESLKSRTTQDPFSTKTPISGPTGQEVFGKDDWHILNNLDSELQKVMADQPETVTRQ